ncbi:hypothetical protein HAZT_HAZT003652, partial [Hyalella azteca]
MHQTSSVLYGDDCDQPYYDKHDEEVEITLMAAGDASDGKMDSLLAEKLKKLLIDMEQEDPALLKSVDNVTRNCETCIKYKKQHPRPVVALSMAKTFNETVAMDLKVWRIGTYFLVLMDLATRFCRAILIRDKKAETIIKCLFTDWISLFGAPKQFLSDNGGEFNNDEMRGVADSFAIKL